MLIQENMQTMFNKMNNGIQIFVTGEVDHAYLGEKEKVAKFFKLWISHKRNNCTVCYHYTSQKKPGLKPKGKSGNPYQQQIGYLKEKDEYFKGLFVEKVEIFEKAILSQDNSFNTFNSK